MTSFDQFALNTPNYESHLRAAFAEWVEQRAAEGSSVRAKKALKPESALVYQEMWHAFAFYCARRTLRLETVSADELRHFLRTRMEAPAASRSKGDARTALTPRYSWRMLTLIDRVTEFYTSKHGLRKNTAALVLLGEPEYRFANAVERDGVPEYLSGADTRRLIDFLTAPDEDDSGADWKQLRDRTAIALMLGGGLSPGDVRAMQTSGISSHDLFDAERPWQIALPGNGNAPARDTILEPWAAQRLSLWLDIRKKKRIPGAFVFPSTLAGKAWSHTSCYEACKLVLQQANLVNKDGGVFKLRHTFALRQLLAGKSESEVAGWLGLLDPASMTRYQAVLEAQGGTPKTALV